MRNFVAVPVRNSSRKVGRQPKHWMELTMFAHDRVRFLGLSHLSGFEIHPSMHVSCLSHVTCTDWLRKGSCTWLKGLPILSAMPHITLWEVSQEHGRKLLACWKLYDDVDGKYMFALLQFLRSNAFVRASLWKPSTKTILSLFACVLVCIICWHVGFFNSTFLACF